MTRPIHEILKEARLKKGVDLERASRDTFIPLRFLKDMEEGNWQDFPSFVHKIGFLKKYLTYLKVPQEIIGDYSEFKPPEDEMGDKEQIGVIKKETRLPIYILTGLILIFGAVLLMFRWVRSGQPDTKISEQSGSFEITEGKSSGILLKASEDVWVRVISDGRKTLERTLKKDDAVEISGQKINIRAGNAGGLLIEKDGKTSGPLGKTGQVIEINIEGGLFTP